MPDGFDTTVFTPGKFVTPTEEYLTQTENLLLLPRLFGVICSVTLTHCTVRWIKNPQVFYPIVFHMTLLNIVDSETAALMVLANTCG